MAKTCFSVIDLAVTAISLFSFVLDIGTDVAVSIQYLCSGLVIWGWLTLALTLVPAIVMNIFSLAWHIHDKTVNTFIVVSHVLLLAPVHRYVDVLHLGVKSRKSQKVVHSQKAWRAQNDVSILRLFEAFMESAPQLVLQLFIIVHHKKINWFTGLSACASFLSLSWALTAYSDSLRRACKLQYHRRIAGLLLHWGWQLFMALSRISAFVLLAYVIETWVFVGIGVHWLLSFVWICIQKTDFGNGPCEKWMFRAVCAFIYIFVFLNLNDGVSRYRQAAFYVVLLLENTAMVAVYFVLGDGNHPIITGTTVFGGFLLGLVCMCLYYSFLHPTKPAIKPWLPRQRSSKSTRSTTSSSYVRSAGPSASQGQGPVPIFSIESPQSISVMDGTSINLSTHNTRSLTSSALQPSHTKRSALAAPLQVNEALKHKWQTGMDSSCTSSTSSLASDLPDVNKIERPSSRASEDSNESEHSNNCLLSSKSENNLNKNLSPRRKLKSLQFMDKISNSDPSFNTDSNVYGPESPSLSRCSWARSSDDTRQSLGVEEFVTLGFDCSSSIERRFSENGSFNNRPKSLSPLNVSNLWHDARSKLRQTIAATVAAATCNPSSNECTPNNSHSFVSQTTSSQDESLSSMSRNFGFLDPKSSFNEKDRERISSVGSSSLNSGRHREALSSLSDISETAEHEELSDISCEVSVKKSPQQQNSNSASPWFNSDNSAKHSGSPYLEDSTLTASKLGHAAVTPISYLTAQNRMQSSQDSKVFSQSRHSTNSTPSSYSRPKYNPDGSPFTDQELTSVMAKSLQSYSGASSSTDSTNKEREGLALTLEDLEYPADLEVGELEEQVTTSLNLIDSLTKSRSTSSLFHDVDDSSSPASSASKMQRVTDLQRPDSEISPNAFKHLDLSPSYLMAQSKSPAVDSKVISDLQKTLACPQNSEALKILIEAYGQLSMRSPRVQQTPDCSKLSVHRNSPKSNATCEIDNNISKDFTGKVSAVKRINPEFKVFRENECEHLETNKATPRKSIELFDSIAWQKSKLMAKQQKSGEHVLAYGGHSSTKKLNVHINKQVFELHNSPQLRSSSKPEDNEAAGYVEGMYCPPLCKSSVEMEEEYIQNNLNFNQNHPYKSHSPKKDILLGSINSGSTTTTRHGVPSHHQRSANLQRNHSRGSVRHHQQSEFSHLHPQDCAQAAPRHSLDSFDLCLDNSWDINEARLVADSPLSYSRHRRSLSRSSSSSRIESHPHPAQMEQELKMSAKQVENYFSKALKNVPLDETNMSHSEVVNVHSGRQPLKSLQNSPKHSLHASQHRARQSHHYRQGVSEWSGGDGRSRRNIGDVNTRPQTGASRRLSLDGRFI